MPDHNDQLGGEHQRDITETNWRSLVANDIERAKGRARTPSTTIKLKFEWKQPAQEFRVLPSMADNIHSFVDSIAKQNKAQFEITQITHAEPGVGKLEVWVRRQF